MTQYLVIAHDGTDTEAAQRRDDVRDAHLAYAAKHQESGNLHVGGAILNDEGKMIGSSVIVEFANKEDLNTWLDNDPYVTGKVWQDIEIKPFRIAKEVFSKN